MLPIFVTLSDRIKIYVCDSPFCMILFTDASHHLMSASILLKITRSTYLPKNIYFFPRAIDAVELVTRNAGREIKILGEKGKREKRGSRNKRQI